MNAIRKRIRAFADLLLHEHTAPGAWRRRCFVGAVVGCTPLFGLHICRLHRAGVALSPQPARRLRRGEPVDAADDPDSSASPRCSSASASCTAAGSGCVAPTSRSPTCARSRAPSSSTGASAGSSSARRSVRSPAPSSGRFCCAVARASCTTRDAIGAAIERARRRYDGLHPRFKWYARMKYVMDPCYRAIAPLRAAEARSPSISAAASACCRCCSASSATAAARSASNGIARKSTAACTPRASSRRIESSRATRAPPNCRRATSSRSSTCCTTGTTTRSARCCRAAAPRCVPAADCWCARAIRRAAAARAGRAPIESWS